MPVNLTLKKSEFNAPWGFRLNGGKDFGAPLTVQRIKPDSIAARSGLREGDNISVINNESTHGLKHIEAQDVIKKGGCLLNLVICRGEEVVMKSSKKQVNTYENNHKEEEDVKLPPSTQSNFNASITSNNNYKSIIASQPFKAPPSISSNNSSLYKPSMHTITSGLTKLQTDDDFPPPPPQTFSPQKLSPMPIPEVSVQCNKEEKEDKEDKDQASKDLVYSETLKLVKDLDSGADIPFSPKTGAGVKSSPIQSRLMGILEKKHEQVQYEMKQEDPSRGPGKFFSSPRSPMTPSRNDISESKSPTSVTNSNHFNFNKTSSSRLQPSPQQQQPSFSPNRFPHQVPAHPPTSQSRKLIESLDKGAVPICNVCNAPVRGAYVLAINKIWCPEHFVCSNATCKKPLSNTGFVEEGDQLYCKEDFEQFFAPKCEKCTKPIVGNTVKALNQTYHPECFRCQQCNQPIAGGVFHLHEGKIYCDKDFTALFSTKCHGCKFVIEVGDNWIEAVGTNWHGECFNCSVCQVNLQKTGFVHRSGKFLCKEHARMA